MRIDDTDALILKELINVKKTSSYDIAKKILGIDKKRRLREISDKSKTIQYKLERLAKEGIVKITKKNKKSYYSIADRNKCFIQEGEVLIPWHNGKNVIIDLKDFIVINPRVGDIIIKSL